LQQELSVLEHCHAIDTSQLITTGQLSFLRIIMNVMPFAAQTYTLQLQAFGAISRQSTPVPSDLYGFSTTSIAK